jgi:hypothetical protein
MTPWAHTAACAGGTVGDEQFGVALASCVAWWKVALGSILRRSEAFSTTFEPHGSTVTVGSVAALAGRSSGVATT